MFALRRHTSITLSFLLALFILNCAQLPAVRQGVFYSQVRQPMVAVKLLEGQKILVSPANNFAIRCFKNGIQTANYFSTADIEVKVNSSFIIWGQENQSPMESNLSKVIFEPKSKENWLSLNGKRYHGALEIVLDRNKNLLVGLNIVNLEDYLRGVVPAEMGKRKKGEIEALKAQAIAARTYALSKMGQYDGVYDLKATIYDQVYAGMDGEESLVSQAVDQTGGKILTYQDKVIQAYYHANCGGRTERLEEVWSGMGEPYLLSVEDGDFCNWSGNYRWEEEWSKKELEERLFEFLSEREVIAEEDFGRLLDLRILDRAPSGRVKVLLVSTDRGDFRIEKDKIRWALKRTKDLILPSTIFDLEITRGADSSLTKVKAVGRGSGHGIGMCQTGAIGMANRGFSYSEILTHYYPGTKVLKYY